VRGEREKVIRYYAYLEVNEFALFLLVAAASVVEQTACGNTHALG
jgi:hypothetical protein